MALKRQQRMLATFSMASMTDVIFLLLVFFMVTSTFVFPTALEVNLPESSEQTAIKPSTLVFVNDKEQIFVAAGEQEPIEVSEALLPEYLTRAKQLDKEATFALYADTVVSYGKVARILAMAAHNNLDMVLATKAAPAAFDAVAGTQAPLEQQ